MTTPSPAVVATGQPSVGSVYKPHYGSQAPKCSTSRTSTPGFKETPSTMSVTPGSGNNHVKEPYWGPETDYIFDVDTLKLPKLSTVESESNARVLAKMMRQKLIYKIKTFSGREPRNRIAGSEYLDPLQSDPAEPYFYEWRFTPEYPGFPLRPLAKWREEETKACHAALKNGDVYLVDPRNHRPREPRKEGAAPTVGQKIPGSEAHNRERLINLAESAFSRYIVTETGITAFDYGLVLDGDGSRGLPGWRWIFPKTGILSKFPELKNFWNWTIDEILHALHFLLQKKLRLERFDRSQVYDAGSRALPQANFAAPRPQNNFVLTSNEPPQLYYSNSIKPPYQHTKPTQTLPSSRPLGNHIHTPIDSRPQPSNPPMTNNYRNPINVETPNPSKEADRFMAHMNAASVPKLPRPNKVTPAPGVHALDDLVTQLTDQSQRWKQDLQDLQASRARERSLAKANSEQATRIGLLVKAVDEVKRLGAASNEIGKSVQQQANASIPNAADVMAGMEAFFRRELSDLQAQNDELREVIEDQKEDLKNAIWLRDRNKELEALLAEKTKEATSAYEALSVLSSSSALSQAAGLSTSGLESSQVKCDSCAHNNQFCVNPGGPCGYCRRMNKACTFETSTGISDVLAKARKATESASQFLQKREYRSPYYSSEEMSTKCRDGEGQSKQTNFVSMTERLEQQNQKGQNERPGEPRKIQRASHSSQITLPQPVRPQSISSSTSGSASGTPQPQPYSPVNEDIKRTADDNLASVNKRLATEEVVQSPYVSDSAMTGTWETTVADLDEQLIF